MQKLGEWLRGRVLLSPEHTAGGPQPPVAPTSDDQTFSLPRLTSTRTCHTPKGHTHRQKQKIKIFSKLVENLILFPPAFSLDIAIYYIFITNVS